MNDLSLSDVSTDRSAQEILDAVVDSDARISRLDRLSLRLGLWLLLRSSRRLRRRHTAHDHALALARLRAAQERDRAAAWAFFSLPPSR